jgi:tetratricopeptide (TPR) repeat protein
MILNDLGVLYREGQQYDQALKTYQRLAALWKNQSLDDPNYILAARNMIVSYVYLNDFENAGKWYQGLQASLKKKDPAQWATASKAYADALRAKGREKEARKVEDQAGLPHSKKGK